MFMLFFIRVAPLLAAVSCDFFKLDRNFLAVSVGLFDFNNIFIAFCRSGSVALTDIIFFADDFVGDKRNVLTPAFATFSAPCIFTDFMSARILSKRDDCTFFFMDGRVDKTLKRYVCIRLNERSDDMIELLEYQGVGSVSILFEVVV